MPRFRFSELRPAPERDGFRDMLGALSGFGEVLERRRAQEREDERLRIQEARQAASEAYMRGQNAIQEKRAKEKHDAEMRAFADQNADRNKKNFDDLYGRYLQGGRSEAEAYSKATEHFDPVTGQRTTFAFEPGKTEMRVRGGRLQQPAQQHKPFFPTLVERLRPPMGAPDPATENLRAMFKLRGPDVRPPSEDAPMLEREETADAIVTPRGERINLDPGEREAYRVRQEQQRADRLREVAAQVAATDPRRAADMMAEAARIEAALGGASSQHLRNRESQDDSQAATAEENQKYRLTAGDQKQMHADRIAAMKKRGGPKAPDPMKTKRSDDLDAAAADTSFQKFASNVGMAKAMERAQKFTEMSDHLGVGNSALDSVVAGRWIKMSQGDSGVISDKDASFFWGQLGGIGLKTEEAVMRALNGEMGPEKRRLVLEAVGKLKSSTEGQLAKIASQGEGYIKTGPHAASWPRFRAAYFPWYSDKLDDRGRPLTKGGAAVKADPYGEDEADALLSAKKKGTR